MSGLMLLVLLLILIVGIVQLPLLVDLIRSCLPNSRAVPRRLVGPAIHTLLAFIMMMIYLSVFYLYFWTFLPAHIGGDPWVSDTGLCHIVFFFFLYLNSIANYVCAVFVPPGHPPKITMTPDNQMSISIENCIPKEKICVECKCIKAETTHHCSVCQTCVLHMDHHCPFVMGCVGLGNYHYFYTFMVTFYLGMLYSLYLMIGPFKHCHGMPYGDLSYTCSEVGTPSILFIVVGLNIPGATLVNTFNTLSLLSNTTTMSCLLLSMSTGLRNAAAVMRSEITLANLTDKRSRLHVVILSRRKKLVYFVVPPILTAIKLFLKYMLTKKRTISFKIPRIPKRTGLIA